MAGIQEKIGRVDFYVAALAVMLVAAVAHFWSWKRDLPYLPEVDEVIFVSTAGRMAQQPTWNPGWFGNPGSTLIYPLAVAYRAHDLLVGRSADLTQAGYLTDTYDPDQSPYYLIGRFIGILYTLLTLPLVVLIGIRMFGEPMGRWLGLAAALMFTLSSLVVFHTQLIRTDGVGTFFFLLAFWQILKLSERPTRGQYVLTGLCIGLATATRYMLLSLAALVPLVMFFHLWPRQRSVVSYGAVLVYGAIAGLAAAAGFFMTSPYIFIEVSATLAQLASEARTYHPGADGLNPMGKLNWYVTAALPDMLSWAHVYLGVVGMGFALWTRRREVILVTAYIVIYLLSISVLSLHWHRWLIQIIPLFTLLVAYGTYRLVRGVMDCLARGTGRAPRITAALAAALLVAINAPVASGLVKQAMRYSHYSTQVTARAWVDEHIPAGTKMAMEWFTLPAYRITQEVVLCHRMAQENIEALRADGVEYIIISGGVFFPYLLEPDRFPDEYRFYNTLIKSRAVVQHLKGSVHYPGPDIFIINLDDFMREKELNAEN